MPAAAMVVIKVFHRGVMMGYLQSHILESRVMPIVCKLKEEATTFNKEMAEEIARKHKKDAFTFELVGV